MPNSIITLQVGQCGNQLGTEFWKRMCPEHGIDQRGQEIGTEGEVGEVEDHCDRKDIFFNEANYGQKYVPRAVLIDLEPRVLNEITSEENSYNELFNPDNVFHDPTGGGAGNIWGRGYKQPNETIEQIFDIITSEVERADSLDGMALCHSVMGGTGSGLGSRLLLEVRERFPKTIMQTYTVISPLYPDVNVAPYNVVPSLDFVSEFSDFTILFDNDAFHRFAKDGVHSVRARYKVGSSQEDLVDKKNYAQINSMMAQIMTGLSAPIRFYSPIYSRLMHIAATLNPFPPMQFIQPAFTPFTPLATTNINKPLSFHDARPIVSHIMNPNQLITSAPFLLQKMAEEQQRSKRALAEKQPVTRSVSDAEIASNSPNTHVRQRVPSGTSSVGRQPISYIGTGSEYFASPSSRSLNQHDYCLIAGLGIVSTDFGYEQLPSSALSSASVKRPSAKTPEYTCPPWLGKTSTIELTRTRLSPYMDHSVHPVQGLLLANHTSVSVLLQRMLQKYTEQRHAGASREGAFLAEYKKEEVVEKMDQAKDSLESLVKLYKEVNTEEFIS